MPGLFRPLTDGAVVLQFRIGFVVAGALGQRC